MRGALREREALSDREVPFCSNSYGDIMLIKLFALMYRILKFLRYAKSVLFKHVKWSLSFKQIKKYYRIAAVIKQMPF